ncbi:MAG TPA: flagellar hook-associated protein FlgK [Tepidiformaceae bacterium]|nr:flagellar hook-associated protein FlgK [Tepidiformaceae bacterium]
MGLSLGLDTAVKALRAHQLAVDVASHNIANANSPGFSRQRVLLRPMGIDGSDHFTRDALLGRTGFGVDAHDVNRVRDVFLDFQARTAMSSRSQSQSYSTAISQTELVFNDPSDEGLSGLIDAYFAAWHDVVNDPESGPARTTLVNAATTLTTRIQRAHTDLQTQRQDLDRRIAGEADKINAASHELAQLNFQIKQVELSGDSANDLRDRRDLLLDQLSELGPVSYTEQDDHSVTVYLGNHELVTGNIARDVEAIPDVAKPGFTQLVFAMDGEAVQSTTGEIKGLFDARDVAVPGVSAKLDALAAGLITSVNTLHQAGFGLDNSTGLAFFTGTGAANIALNATLAGNPNRIAASSAAGSPGNGANALAIADLQLAQTMAAGTATFGEYYGDMVSVLGADASRAQGLAESGTLLVSHLDNLRLSVQGVNIDEEVTNLTSAQHAYQAAARVITAIDQMLETLISNTGVVGR